MTLPASALPLNCRSAFPACRVSNGKLWRDRLDQGGRRGRWRLRQLTNAGDAGTRAGGRDVGIDEVEDFLDPTSRKLMPIPTP